MIMLVLVVFTWEKHEEKLAWKMLPSRLMLNYNPDHVQMIASYTDVMNTSIV